MLFFISCGKYQGINSGVISFTHTGITNHIEIPLYISTHQISIHINKEQMDDLKSMAKDSMAITQAKMNAYIALKFDKEITNSATFYNLSSFIINNDKFYTSDSHRNNNPAADSYIININGKSYSIFYKLKTNFFNQLRIYLLNKDADPKIVEAISHLK